MPVLHIVGVDPGLVHTGCIRMMLDTDNKRIKIDHHVVIDIDAGEVLRWAEWFMPPPRIYIEKYQPRSNFGTDERMVKGEAELRRRMPEAVLLSNTGVKTIVTPRLLQVLGLLTFPQSTHHQDLRSAARIAVLGMMKDDMLNKVLADVVRDFLNDNQWFVVQAVDDYV